MARPTARITLIQVMLGLGMLAVLGRAAQLQLVQGRKWRAEAVRSREERRILPARRGGIYDRNGVELAVTQEYFHVGIAPNELRDPGADARVIARALGEPLGRLQRQLATRKWVALQGPYTGLQVQPLRELHGVHLDGEFARHYPRGNLARGVVGTLKPDSAAGASGVELALDSILTGVPGEAVLLKDRAGRRYDSPSRLQREPVPGHDVRLTLDAELQEIAERALEEAMDRYQAQGGDIVMLDPRTGELLALASRKLVDGQVVTNRATYLTDPFEPGSTAKLFTASALLRLKRVTPADAVHVDNGVWEMQVNSRGDTRTITDAHKTNGDITLAEAIKISSNIAMAKFSQRLSATEQFDALRDFGFGTPSGVEFPSEAKGALRMPDHWDGYSKASIAMGYEFGVTPVQLAAAYGAIANQGILLTPTLVREVYDEDGKVLYRHRPEPVRRAVPPDVARTLLQYLVTVVEEGGTAEGARLTNYSLAGKTGTAQRSTGRGYAGGGYTASFAAVFPAEDPQLVVVVKIDNPKGQYYGGQTAAPLTRSMLEEALAARKSAIDRVRLAGGGNAVAGPERDTEAADSEPAPSRVVLDLPLGDSTGPRERTLVPSVAGSSLRHAATALHRRGFRVAVHGAGRALRTTPVAGDSATAGSLVTIWAE